MLDEPGSFGRARDTIEHRMGSPTPAPVSRIEPVSLHDRTVLIVAGEAGPAGRLTIALEAAGAEVVLVLYAGEAVETVAEQQGLWDLAVIAGEPQGMSATKAVEAIRRADRGLPVATAVPHAAANGGATIGERDPPAAIARTARALMFSRNR